jgi:accessory colonization factor AcfC
MSSIITNTIHNYKDYAIWVGWDKSNGWFADIVRWSDTRVMMRTSYLCGKAQAIRSAKYHIDRKTFVEEW